MEILKKNYVKIDGKKILGQGAYSKVIRIKGIDEQIYALKQIRLKKISNQDFQNLMREIQLHKKLQHKNIIRFYGWVQKNETLNLLLEYANNGCLFYYIDSKKGLIERLALRFFYQICQAVKYLHERNLIHRDIKPENIVMDNNFDCKLCDFGWSCILQDEEYRNTVCGTYEYMSPEIVNKQTHTNKVDIWCLGVLLYEMLHGDSPFQVKSVKEMKKCLKSDLPIADHISKETKSFMGKLLNKNPDQRFSILQVLNHPLMKKQKKNLNPLNSKDVNYLIKNYLKNTSRNSNKILPEIVENYLNQKISQTSENRLIEQGMKQLLKNNKKLIPKKEVKELKQSDQSPFLDFIKEETHLLNVPVLSNKEESQEDNDTIKMQEKQIRKTKKQKPSLPTKDKVLENHERVKQKLFEKRMQIFQQNSESFLEQSQYTSIENNAISYQKNNSQQRRISEEILKNSEYDKRKIKNNLNKTCREKILKKNGFRPQTQNGRLGLEKKKNLCPQNLSIQVSKKSSKSKQSFKEECQIQPKSPLEKFLTKRLFHLKKKEDVQEKPRQQRLLSVQKESGKHISKLKDKINFRKKIQTFNSFRNKSNMITKYPDQSINSKKIDQERGISQKKLNIVSLKYDIKLKSIKNKRNQIISSVKNKGK